MGKLRKQEGERDTVSPGEVHVNRIRPLSMVLDSSNDHKDIQDFINTVLLTLYGIQPTIDNDGLTSEPHSSPMLAVLASHFWRGRKQRAVSTPSK